MAVLFVSAIGLAILLAHAFNRSVSPSVANSTSPAPVATFNQDTTPTSLQLQAKYDRRFAHYATVARSDGSFR